MMIILIVISDVSVGVDSEGPGFSYMVLIK